MQLNNLIKNINQIDLEDICSAWQWLLQDKKSVILVSAIGDMFILGNDNRVYWLQTDGGILTEVADSLSQFQDFLKDDDKVDEWFLPLLIEKLKDAGKILKDSEVYSMKLLGVLGGEYSIHNIEPTDMSIHFHLAGTISEQIKDFPDGTKVNIKIV